MVRSFPLNLLAFVAVVGTCTARAAEDAARDGIHGSSNYDTEAHSDRIENLPGTGHSVHFEFLSIWVSLVFFWVSFFLFRI